MKCDELEKFDAASNADLSAGYDHRYAYEADEVDAAIAELKARIADLEGLNHDLCQRVTENDGIRQHWEEIEQTRAENERLKAKLVEQDAKNRRLKRALWRARAEWARSSALSYHLIESHPDKDVSATYKRKANKWEKAKDKCLKKAEEYK
jgi:predicted RNase H-like nuclease (RuvC/YqgF family)